jgi:hypothetical protein
MQGDETGWWTEVEQEASPVDTGQEEFTSLRGGTLVRLLCLLWLGGEEVRIVLVVWS